MAACDILATPPPNRSVASKSGGGVLGNLGKKDNSVMLRAAPTFPEARSWRSSILPFEGRVDGRELVRATRKNTKETPGRDMDAHLCSACRGFMRVCRAEEAFFKSAPCCTDN